VLYGLQNDFPNAFSATTLGFSLVAIGFALLTLAALSPHSLLSRIRVPGASRLALWSYAIYLVHKPLFMAARPWLERMHIDTGAPLTVVLVLLAGVIGGWLLFHFVETPFMRLRARWYPAGDVAAAALAGARVKLAAPAGM
jgi:peptidoglycan/LPS O-acetylase OafA/YrhL